MGRSPCCDKSKVKRGSWSEEEDAILKTYILKHGTSGNWIALPQKAGLRRCGKSCRLRWLNYLRPDIKLGDFTPNEENIICDLYKKLGSRWSVIASQMQGRTDNDVKNFWNTKLKKKLVTSDNYTPPANATDSRNTPPASIGPVVGPTTTTPFRTSSSSSPTFREPVFADNVPAGIANESSSSTVSYEPANYDLPRLVLQGLTADNGCSFGQELEASFRPFNGFGKDDWDYVASGVSSDDGYSCEVMSGIWSEEENIGGDGNADLFNIFQF